MQKVNVCAMLHRGKTHVARRRVFYIPGYDPYPPRRYRELYRRESRAQADISGYKIDQKSERSDTGWHVRAEIDGHQVQSKVEVLIWHDLVQGSMKAGIASTYLALLKTSWIYLSTGTFQRLSWLAKGPVLAALYPIAMLLVQLALAVLVGSMLGGGGSVPGGGRRGLSDGFGWPDPEHGWLFLVVGQWCDLLGCFPADDAYCPSFFQSAR